MNKLQKIQRELQEVAQELESAKLMYFDFIGDPDKLPERERSALEKQNIKLAKYLNRLPWKFNFYISTNPGVNALNTEMYNSIRSKIPKAFNALIKKDSSVITIIYGTSSLLGNVGVHAPTPWIILHNICHAIIENSPRNNDLAFNSFDKFIGKLYGEAGAPGGSIRFDSTEEQNDLIYSLFTFRAARKRTSLELFEAFLDFYTQILVNGMKADMVDPIPEALSVGSNEWSLIVSPSKAAKIRKQYLKDQEKMLKGMMDQLVGKYVFI